MNNLRIGLLGCGNIGKFLLSSVNNENLVERGKITSIYSRNYEKTAEIASQYGATAYRSVDEFLTSDLDLVVEVATIEFIKNNALKIIEEKIDVVFSSIGAFGDSNFYEEVYYKSNVNGVNIYIPSGAIGCLDLLKSAKAINTLDKVIVETRKPPISLGVDTDLEKERILFTGSAREAIQKFPKNMNIGIAVSLAGIGADQTIVKVIADPTADKNTHTISGEGAFGEFSITIKNEAMPNNPKTSYLAALSILANIQNKNNALKIG